MASIKLMFFLHIILLVQGQNKGRSHAHGRHYSKIKVLLFLKKKKLKNANQMFKFVEILKNLRIPASIMVQYIPEWNHIRVSPEIIHISCSHLLIYQKRVMKFLVIGCLSALLLKVGQPFIPQ